MMKKMILLLCACLLLSTGAYAASLGTVEINQTAQSSSELYVFFHADDENDEPVTGLTAQEISVELGTQILTPEVETVGSAGLGIGYVFAVDVSRSLTDRDFTAIREKLGAWIGEMGENDRAAILAFGTEVTTIADFTGNTNTINAVLSGLKPEDKGTMLYSGTVKAIDLARRQGEGLPLQRVVIIISDGQDDFTNSTSVQEMQNKAQEAGIPVYVVGIDNGENKEQLDIMGSTARMSGGQIRSAELAKLGEAFDWIRAYIQNGFVVAVPLNADIADGSEKGLVLTVSHAGYSVDDSLDVRVRTYSQQTQTGEEETETQIWAGVETETVSTQSESYAAPDVVTEESDATPTGQTEAEQKNQSGEEESPFDEAGGLAAGLVANKLYIYIGAGVLVLAGVCVYLLLMLGKRKKKQEKKQADYSAGYGSTAHLGGNTGTMDLSNYDNGTMPLGDYMGGGALVLTDAARGQSYSVRMKDRITIGRREGGNDIVVKDAAVSGLHCEIIWEGGRLYVRDAGSSNGTFVIDNGLRYQVDSVSGVELKWGNEIDIGNTKLELTNS